MSLVLKPAETLSTLPASGIDLLAGVEVAVGVVAMAAFAAVLLRQRLSVEPLAPDAGDPYSVRFSVVNRGLLPLRDLRTRVYLHAARVGNQTFGAHVEADAAWNREALRRGESVTLFAHLIESPERPIEANLAIVVDCKAFSFQRRFVSRFAGRLEQAWRWTPQPAGPIMEALEAMLAERS